MNFGEHTSRLNSSCRARGYKGKVTKEGLLKAWEATNGLCFYCGRILLPATLHWDHKIPLAEGGRNVNDNMAPTCEACNMSKQTFTSIEFLALCPRAVGAIGRSLEASPHGRRAYLQPNTLGSTDSSPASWSLRLVLDHVSIPGERHLGPAGPRLIPALRAGEPPAEISRRRSTPCFPSYGGHPEPFSRRLAFWPRPSFEFHSETAQDAI